MSKFHKMATIKVRGCGFVSIDDLILMIYKEASETRKSDLGFSPREKEAVALTLEALANRLERMK